MATKHSTRPKGTDYRPNYINLGTDSRGASHLYDTRTETVHIIYPDGSRERKLLEPCAGRDVDDYVIAVRNSIGWRTRRYGQSWADHLADVLDVQQ